MATEAPNQEQKPTSRELVPLEGQHFARPASSRPQAPFVAQLLACRESLEPYRRYRRAVPGEAAASYHLAEAPANEPTHFERNL